MRFVCPECVPGRSRGSLAIVEPRLCGSSPGRTFSLLGLKVGLANYQKVARLRSWSREWARHRNKYKRAHGAAADELAGTWTHPGRRIVLPSLFTFCQCHCSFTRRRFSFQCGGGSGLTRRKRAQVGPIDTDVMILATTPQQSYALD